MAGETKIKGDVLILSVYDGTSAYRPIACITSNELTSEAEILENKTKCDPGVVIKDYGSISTSISAEGQYIDTTSAGGYTTKASHDYLLDLQTTKTKRTVKIATGLADTTDRYGTAMFANLVLTGDAGEISTFTVDIEIDGALTTVDPHA